VLAEGWVHPPATTGLLIPFLAQLRNSMFFEGLCLLLGGPATWEEARRSEFSPIPHHYSAAVGTR